MKIHFLTKDNVLLIADQISDLETRAMILVCYSGALRLNELHSLAIGDYSPASKEPSHILPDVLIPKLASLKVHSKKGCRTVYLFPEAQQALEAYMLDGYRKATTLPTTDSFLFKGKNFTRNLKEIALGMGYKTGITVYDLRVSMAISMAKSGMIKECLADFLGIKNVGKAVSWLRANYAASL